MKILNAKQIRAWDQFTIENEPVSSYALMERASSKCFEWISNKFDKAHSFTFFCGTGNNGGDGLAIARMLINEGYKVKVYLVKISEKLSPDCQKNYEKLSKLTNILELGNDHFDVEENNILVDAVFGSGLNRPIQGFIKAIVQTINSLEHFKISIDIPSGLFADDNTDNDLNAIIKANVTLTFQVPKLSFLLPENAVFVGDWKILDIGLHQAFLKTVDTKYFYTDLAYCKKIYKPRPKYSHKGTYGHALLIAGSKGKIGAAVLAAKASLRAGIGLLTVHTANCGYTVLQTAVPEAMTLCGEHDCEIDFTGSIDPFDVIGIGPGIGKGENAQKTLKYIIQNAKVPVVLDADALNILAENKTWLSFLPLNAVLTPHPKEFERLAGKWSSDTEKLDLQREFAFKYNCIVVLKGAHTSIAFPDGNIWFNSTGNPGMATAGAGDVLTGIITGLAGYYDDADATILGVFLHGLAGDKAAYLKSQESVIATDIIDNIGFELFYD